MSVALRRRGAIGVGAVYDPCRAELFSATLSSHSTLNGAPIGVQQISEGFDAFEKPWASTRWPRDQDTLDQAMKIAASLGPQVITFSALASRRRGLCNTH